MTNLNNVLTEALAEVRKEKEAAQHAIEVSQAHRMTDNEIYALWVERFENFSKFEAILVAMLAKEEVTEEAEMAQELKKLSLQIMKNDLAPIGTREDKIKEVRLESHVKFFNLLQDITETVYKKSSLIGGQNNA